MSDKITEVSTESSDGKDERSTKLKNILDKIRKKNNNPSDVTLNVSDKNTDDATRKFTILQLNDSVVGDVIIDKRFKNGHLKNFHNGEIIHTYKEHS